MIMKKRVKIACLGDSVVYGRGIRQSREQRVWTALLEKHLNEEILNEQSNSGRYEYKVSNFGLNGQGVLPGAFIAEGQLDAPLYKEMLRSRPDAVFVHVGGNDSHIDTWNEEAFHRAYRELTEELVELCGRKHVCLMCSTYAVTQSGAEKMLRYGLQNEIVKYKINPVIEDTAEELGTELFDPNEVFMSVPNLREHGNEFYADEIHPNEAGNELIANAACALAREWNF